MNLFTATPKLNVTPTNYAESGDMQIEEDNHFYYITDVQLTNNILFVVLNTCGPYENSVNFYFKIWDLLHKFSIFTDFKITIQGYDTVNKTIVDLHNEINLSDVYNFNSFYSVISKSDRYEQYQDVLEPRIRVKFVAVT